MQYYNIYGQNELYHYGVKGMKWGVRKKTLKKAKATVKKATATAKATAKKATAKVKESATSAASAIKRGASATKNFLKKHGGTLVKVALVAAAVTFIGYRYVQAMSALKISAAAKAAASAATTPSINALQYVNAMPQLINTIRAQTLIPFKPW